MMDSRTLSRLVREWLRRLSMRGWTVTVQIVRHDAFASTYGRGVYHADVEPDPQHQRATMRVLCRRDLLKHGLDPSAIEETIVHELLHLRLDPMSALARDAAFEMGLDALAEEFVRLARVERGKRKSPPR